MSEREDLWRFIIEAHEKHDPGLIQYKIPGRWMWQFVLDPFIKEPSGLLPVWLAFKDNRIVGQQCSMAVEVTIGEKVYDGSWSCDTIVSEECRGEGIASRLKQVYFEHYQVSIAIDMAPIIRRIWEKAGGVEIAPVNNYCLFIRLDRALIRRYLIKRTLGRPRLNRAIKIACKYFFFHVFICTLANSLLSTRKRFLKSLSKRSTSDIEEVFEFGKEIDELYERTYGDYSAIVRRNAEFLNWRFFQNQQLEYRAFVSRKNDNVTGYVIIRRPHPAELNMGNIVDFLTARSDLATLRDLLRHAILHFGDSVVGLKCSSSVADHEKLLTSLGFIKTSRFRPIIVCKNSSLRKQIIGVRDDWYLTAADQDLDQIRPA